MRKIGKIEASWVKIGSGKTFNDLTCALVQKGFDIIIAKDVFSLKKIWSKQMCFGLGGT